MNVYIYRKYACVVQSWVKRVEMVWCLLALFKFRSNSHGVSCLRLDTTFHVGSSFHRILETLLGKMPENLYHWDMATVSLLQSFCFYLMNSDQQAIVFRKQLPQNDEKRLGNVYGSDTASVFKRYQYPKHFCIDF